jgi:hypothetical protein
MPKKTEAGGIPANTPKEEVKETLTDDLFKPMKYRYYCDACTNIAFKSDEIKEGLKGICAVCGKPYVTRKENFILL